MGTLKDYMFVESLDVDNLIYKIDTWFANNVDEKTSFDNMIQQFKKDNVVNKNVVNDYINNSKIKVKNFVDYLSDNIYDNEINDYMYVFGKIIDTLVANKQI